MILEAHSVCVCVCVFLPYWDKWGKKMWRAFDDLYRCQALAQSADIYELLPENMNLVNWK